MVLKNTLNVESIILSSGFLNWSFDIWVIFVLNWEMSALDWLTTCLLRVNVCNYIWGVESLVLSVSVGDGFLDWWIIGVLQWEVNIFWYNLHSNDIVNVGVVSESLGFLLISNSSSGCWVPLVSWTINPLPSMVMVMMILKRDGRGKGKKGKYNLELHFFNIILL